MAAPTASTTGSPSTSLSCIDRAAGGDGAREVFEGVRSIRCMVLVGGRIQRHGGFGCDAHRARRADGIDQWLAVGNFLSGLNGSGGADDSCGGCDVVVDGFHRVVAADGLGGVFGSCRRSHRRHAGGCVGEVAMGDRLCCVETTAGYDVEGGLVKLVHGVFGAVAADSMGTGFGSGSAAAADDGRAGTFGVTVGDGFTSTVGTAGGDVGGSFGDIIGVVTNPFDCVPENAHGHSSSL